MTPARPALIAALAATSCTVYHRCDEVRPLLDLDRSVPPAGAAVASRALPPTDGSCPEGELSLFTRAADYDGPEAIDFSREEVVQVCSRQSVSEMRVAWFVETGVDLRLGVVMITECGGGTPPPRAPPIDLAIPLSTRPVVLVPIEDGPTCDPDDRRP